MTELCFQTIENLEIRIAELENEIAFLSNLCIVRNDRIHELEAQISGQAGG